MTEELNSEGNKPPALGGNTGDPSSAPSSVDRYYDKLTEILEFDRKHTVSRHWWAWAVVVILFLLLGYCVYDTHSFVEEYMQSIKLERPIPEKFAITFISISAVKISAIVGVAAGFLFRGFPHQILPKKE